MKTTKKQFDIFKKECERWINEFGLFGSRFYFQHEDYGDGDENTQAYCIMPDEHQDRIFTVGLPKKLNGETSIDEIKENAFHEVMESFLYRIKNIARCRYVQREEIDDEIHNIIMTLEKVVFNRGK